MLNQQLINSLDPLDENEIYNEPEAEYKDDFEFLTFDKKPKKPIAKVPKKRTWELTLVLVLNYGLLSFLGIVSIYAIPKNLIVSSLLFIIIGYGILLIKWVQDYNDTARVILSIIVMLEVILSINFSIYYY